MKMLPETSSLGKYFLCPNSKIKFTFFVGILLQVSALALAIAMLSTGGWVTVRLQNGDPNNRFGYAVCLSSTHTKILVFFTLSLLLSFIWLLIRFHILPYCRYFPLLPPYTLPALVKSSFIVRFNFSSSNGHLPSIHLLISNVPTPPPTPPPRTTRSLPPLPNPFQLSVLITPYQTLTFSLYTFTS